ncbi:MAG: hypothetical protein A2426_04815 [Candidatus Lambdaproteobacteria bacterium RIFOXYC1_FULL_56_13]|nr:MAG: hypothetical protein A2426_04815 [Candidatus Lambdaproteobacteria bacterium RIFOXYC1_FULL_56_13]
MGRLRGSASPLGYQWTTETGAMAFTRRGLGPLRFEEPPDRERLRCFAQTNGRHKSNGHSCFLKRNTTFPPKSPQLGQKTVFPREQDLPVHLPSLHQRLSQFLVQILAQVQSDPGTLPEIARTLRQTLEQEGINLPEIEAFNQIRRVRDFSRLLSSLSRRMEIPYRVELAFSLVHQFERNHSEVLTPKQRQS